MTTNFKSLKSISELSLSNQRFVETGISTLDAVINGFYQGELIVLASRPGIGKSSICMIIASQIAMKQNLPVAVFSLGTKNEQFYFRTIENFRNFYYLNSDFVENENIDLNEIRDNLIKSPVYIDDTPYLELNELQDKCTELYNKLSQNLGLIVVDGFDLISLSNKNKTKKEIAIEKSKKLSEIAGLFKCPVVVTTNLNRNLESRDYKQPIISDLKLNGSVVTHADLLLFLHRPQAYESESSDAISICIGKNRRGPLGIAKIGDFLSINWTLLK